MNSKSILITGGSGFLGSALIADWLKQGHRMTVISRNPLVAMQKLGAKVNVVDSLKLLPAHVHFDAVVNLAGAPIFGSRWSVARKQLLRDSRIKLTEQLVGFLAELPVKPEVLISGSAIGVYGSQADRLLTESSNANPDFSQQLCADWESAALKAETLGIRVCLVRTGLVLDKDGGLLQRMLPAFRLGMGGQLGDGRQWMSWIHRQDWVEIVDTLLSCTDLQGAFNATAPQPVSNLEFSRSLARHLHRPMLMPLPARLLKLLLGEMSELVLGSQRVIPERLQTAGFKFGFTRLDDALTQILGK